jgi:hypothetical protein
MVESLVLEGRRCTGVRYSSRGSKREVRAAREVIVAAGTIASPQLLEFSGIGQGPRLKGLGIEVRHECHSAPRPRARSLKVTPCRPTRHFIRGAQWSRRFSPTPDRSL